MVELICAVAAHFYIEQCIEILNVFKVNHKGNIFWGLIDIFIKFKYVMSHGFDVAGWRKVG